MQMQKRKFTNIGKSSLTLNVANREPIVIKAGESVTLTSEQVNHYSGALRAFAHLLKEESVAEKAKKAAAKEEAPAAPAPEPAPAAPKAEEKKPAPAAPKAQTANKPKA